MWLKHLTNCPKWRLHKKGGLVAYACFGLLVLTLCFHDKRFQIQYHAFAFWIVGIDLRFGLLALALCFAWQEIPNSMPCVCVLDCWYGLCGFHDKRLQIQYNAFAFWIVGIDFVFFMTKDCKFNTMRLRFGVLVLTLCFSWQKIPNSIPCVCVLDCWYWLCVFHDKRFQIQYHAFQAYATSPPFLCNLHLGQFVKCFNHISWL